MADGFLAGQKQGFVQLAAEQRRVARFDLKHRAASAAFGEEDARNIEKRINPCHLVDFAANQVDRLGVGIQGDADTLSRAGFLGWWRAGAAIGEVVAAALGWAALVAITEWAVRFTPPRLALAGFVRIGCGSGFEGLRGAAGACPGRTEGKF